MSLRIPAGRFYSNLAREGTEKYGGKSLDAAIRHSVSLVRDRDDEFFKWATTVVKSRQDRAAALVLKALQLEFESIQYAARTETLLRMRYQWWRDSIGKAFAATKSYEMAQPVMKAFSELVQSYGTICQDRVHAMLDAYEMDAMRGETFFQSLDDLERFARNSSGQMIALQMEACNVDKYIVDSVALSLGTGIGMTAALRQAMGSLSKYGISYFPEDVCRRHGVKPDDFFDGTDKREELKGIAREVALVAQGHLKVGSRGCAAGGSGGKPFALQGLASELYLDGLGKNGYDLLTANGVSPVQYLLKLKWRALSM